MAKITKMTKMTKLTKMAKMVKMAKIRLSEKVSRSFRRTIPCLMRDQSAKI